MKQFLSPSLNKNFNDNNHTKNNAILYHPFANLQEAKLALRIINIKIINIKIIIIIIILLLFCCCYNIAIIILFFINDRNY